MRPQARLIVIGDAPETWEALGFDVVGNVVDFDGVRIELTGEGGGIRELFVQDMGASDPDGLPLRPSRGHALVTSGAHPNTAVAVDHVVAVTDTLWRTSTELERSRLDLRNQRYPPAAPIPQAFFNLSTLVLELAEGADEPPPEFWGITIVVEDLDVARAVMGDALGNPREAVQPGRRIATVRGEAGLSTAMAFMTPRV